MDAAMWGQLWLCPHGDIEFSQDGVFSHTTNYRASKFSQIINRDVSMDYVIQMLNAKLSPLFISLFLRFLEGFFFPLIKSYLRRGRAYMGMEDGMTFISFPSAPRGVLCLLKDSLLDYRIRCYLAWFKLLPGWKLLTFDVSYHMVWPSYVFWYAQISLLPSSYSLAWTWCSW